MRFTISSVEYCGDILADRGIPFAIFAVPDSLLPEISPIVVFTGDLRDLVLPAALEVIQAYLAEWKSYSAEEMHGEFDRMKEWSTGTIRMSPCGECSEKELHSFVSSHLKTTNIYPIAGEQLIDRNASLE